MYSHPSESKFTCAQVQFPIVNFSQHLFRIPLLRYFYCMNLYSEILREFIPSFILYWWCIIILYMPYLTSTYQSSAHPYDQRNHNWTMLRISSHCYMIILLHYFLNIPLLKNYISASPLANIPCRLNSA